LKAVPSNKISDVNGLSSTISNIEENTIIDLAQICIHITNKRTLGITYIHFAMNI